MAQSDKESVHSSSSESTLEENTKKDSKSTKPLDVEHVTEKKIPYPKSVFFVIGNEFCERFSHYGMRAVLTLYLRDALGFPESTATVLYHGFIMLCYLTPLMGAIVADSILGRFRTIFYLSIVYAIGNIVLSCAAIPYGIPAIPFSMVGLVLIALGTGGIKPCVSAFGGDQFVRPQQEKQLQQYFSIFYFSINAGSLLSTILTPILREDVQCFGEETCFPLAFGLPSVLMLVAVVIFLLGKPMYKMTAPEGNIMAEVCKCVWYALRHRGKGEKREHWLDYADKKFSKQLIKDTKGLMHILILYLPIPIYFALYDQQGSRWTFQATRMDGTLVPDSFSIKPDQIQVVNPILILILVPFFESVVYPLFDKCGLLTPLQRITVGGMLTGVAFVISAVLELQLKTTYPQFPESGYGQLNVVNMFPCNVNVTIANQGDGLPLVYHLGSLRDVQIKGKTLPSGNYQATLIPDAENCSSYHLTSNFTREFEVVSEESHTIMLTYYSDQQTSDIVNFPNEDQLDKSSNGKAHVRFLYNLGEDWPVDQNISLKQGGSTKKTIAVNGTFLDDWPGIGDSNQTYEIDDAKYDVYLGDLPNKTAQITLKPGGSHIITIQKTGPEKFVLQEMTITTPNNVNMLWIVPQYFVLSVGEVLISVTGLSFSFSQAPASMKSVIISLWQLCDAFGNLIVILVAESRLLEQWAEFFLFAGLIFVAMFIFAIIAVRYEYVNPEENEEKQGEKEVKEVEKKEGHDSDDD